MSFGPEPIADQDTEPFWTAAAERRLVVQRCGRCERWIWQPQPLCPSCHAPDPQWTEIDGSGRLFSWTVVYPPVLRAWQNEVPFTVVLVELSQGVRMVGRLADGDPEDLRMGQPMTLRWRTTAGRTLPAWAPA
jgi:uncharacterized OB-fold protein